MQYVLTIDHAASSYGMPVLVDASGVAYGPCDIVEGRLAAELVVELAVAGSLVAAQATKFLAQAQPLTSDSAARLLGLTVGRIRQMARSGKLGQRMGRDWAIPWADILDVMLARNEGQK